MSLRGALRLPLRQAQGTLRTGSATKQSLFQEEIASLLSVAHNDTGAHLEATVLEKTEQR
jgi:hypothetical protein